MKLLIKSILLLFVTCSFLHAEVDKKRLAAAQDLASVMKLKDQMMTGFDAMLPMIEQQAEQLNLNADQKKELNQIYKDWFTIDLDLDKLEKEVIKLYAEEFSVKELGELKVFYLTPVGQKTLQILPQLTQKSAKLGMKAAQEKQHLLMNRLEPFLREVQGR